MGPLFVCLAAPAPAAPPASAPDFATATRCRYGEGGAAVTACDAIVAAFRTSAATWYNRGNAWLHVAREAQRLGTARAAAQAFARAESDLTRAITLRPDLLYAWLNRGLARYERGNLAGAEADFTRAIELAPDLATAWNNRSLVRLKRGDTAGAKADFDETIRLNKDFGNALVMREGPSLPMP